MINSEIVWWSGISNLIKYFYKVTPVILLVITINCSLLPRITTMIVVVTIVLWITKEPGGISTVLFLISMDSTLEQVRLMAREFIGPIGTLRV